MNPRKCHHVQPTSKLFKNQMCFLLRLQRRWPKILTPNEWRDGFFLPPPCPKKGSPGGGLEIFDQCDEETANPPPPPSPRFKKKNVLSTPAIHTEPSNRSPQPWSHSREIQAFFHAWFGQESLSPNLQSTVSASKPQKGSLFLLPLPLVCQVWSV